MMTLKVEDKVYQNFTSLSAQRQIDRLAGSFEFTATSDDESVFPIKTGQTTVIAIDGEPVLTGHVERIRVDYDAGQHSISIAGRDITGDINDSAALIKTFQGGISLQDMAATLLGEVGLEIDITTDPADLEIPIFKDSEILETDTEQTISGFLEPYCRKRQVLQSTDGLGRLVFARSGVIKAARALINVRGGEFNNVMAASATFTTDKLFNRYIIHAQQNPNAFGISLSSEDIANNQAEAIDADVRSSRVFEASLESSGAPDDCEARANWELSVRRARARTYICTVQGHFQEEGRLWKINELVKVDDEFSDIKEELLITGIEYSQTLDTGLRTQLTCQARDSYTPKPEETDTGGIF